VKNGLNRSRRIGEHEVGAAVGQQRQELGRTVLVGILARESGQQVPRRHDPRFLAPPQQLDVLESGAAFLHQPEDLVAEALDPRLHRLDAAGAHHRQLILAEIGLHLVEQLQIEAAPLQRREQDRGQPQVEDVVDAAHPLDPVGGGERSISSNARRGSCCGIPSSPLGRRRCDNLAPHQQPRGVSTSRSTLSCVAQFNRAK
jgi:hypothetical protein